MSITVNDILTIDTKFTYIAQSMQLANYFNSNIHPYSSISTRIAESNCMLSQSVMPLNLLDVIQTEQTIIEPDNAVEAIVNSQLNFINSLIPEIVDAISVDAVYIALHSKLSEQLEEFTSHTRLYQRVYSNFNTNGTIAQYSPLEVGLINEYSLPYMLSTNVHHFTESLALQSIIHFDSILTDETEVLFSEIYGYESLLELVKSRIIDSAAKIISDTLPKRISYHDIHNNIDAKLAITTGSGLTNNIGLVSNNISDNTDSNEASNSITTYFFYLDLSRLIDNCKLQKISIYNISAALSAISSAIDTAEPDDIIITDCDRRVTTERIGWVHLPIAELNDMRSPIDKLLSIDGASEFKTVNIKLGINTVYSNELSDYQKYQPSLLI